MDNKSEKGAAKKTVNPFKNKKLKYGSLSVLFTVIFIVAVVLVNVVITLLGERFMPSADLTDTELYTIEQTTVDYLKTIEDKVTITVTSDEDAFTGSGTYFFQTNEILKKIAAANGNITLNYVNVITNPGFLANYTEDITSNEIVIESESTKRVKVLSQEDYLNINYNEQYLQYGYYQIDSVEANCEQAAISAIMSVTDTDPVKIAVLTGYNETQNVGLEEILAANSYELESVNITLTESISEDYDFVFIFGPDKDYSVADINKIDKWLDNGGKFGKNLIYVANQKLGDSPNLDGLLDDWGLKVVKGAAFQTDSNYAYSSESGAGSTYQILSVPDTEFDEFTTTSPVFGYNMSVVQSKWESGGYSNMETQSILDTYDGAVIKPQNSGDNWAPGSDDERAVYSVAMQSVKTRFEANTPISSRIVVFGGMEFMSTMFLSTSAASNAELVMNVFNVSCDKEEGITLTPKSYASSTFEITDAQKNTLVVIFVIILPIALIAAGIIIWARRIHR